jgi:glycine/D-amino acid oxidase-like deaminating enzyme
MFMMLRVATVGRSVWLDLLTGDERRLLQPGVPGTFERRPDVLIVGGGILGLATAAACVQTALGSVMVIERDRLGEGASGGAAALLAPTSHYGDAAPHAELGRISLLAWRELQATWPGGVGLVDLDWISLEPKPFGDIADPPNAERLSARAVAELAPDLLNPMPAVIVRGEARLNPLRTLGCLAAALPCVATGVEARGVTRSGDRVTGVATNHGLIQPGAVVFATGLAPTLDGLELELPQTEVKGHMLATEPTAVRLPGTVNPFGTQIEDGRLIGGGDFSDDNGAHTPQPEMWAAHWSNLVAGLPGLQGTRMSHQWCCFRPAHPDRLPVIDRIPGLTNAWLSSGHFRTGILMAAATGRALANWIGSGQRPTEVAAFGAARFGGGVKPRASVLGTDR